MPLPGDDNATVSIEFAQLAERVTMTDANKGTRRVLVIDDNPAIHEDVRKILTHCPTGCAELAAAEAVLFGDPGAIELLAARSPEFKVDSAYQGLDGVALVASAHANQTPYALAFIGGRMPPGPDGIETIARVWQADPNVEVVLCTAHSDYSWQQIRERLPHPERLIILKKPFDAIEVQQLAESLTEKWRLARLERKRVAKERVAQLKEMIAARNSVLRAVSPGSTPQGVPVCRRAMIERALGDALQADQLFVHYQPLVDIATRRVTGLEALLRWRHPELGLVAPGEFIPVAEETGLIVPIGEFVLRSTCAQLARWEACGVPVVPVAVNISAVQLRSGGVWERVRQILQEARVQPRYIALELTESTLMENASEHAGPLQSLRADGVSVEIDDFGTGYSSLSCLKHLPLDGIKIDRSFVTQLETSRTDQTIVAAILTMTHSLGLRTVAEGVETGAQLEVLGRLGCEIAQGYYFSPPVSAKECERLLVDLAGRMSFAERLRLRKRAGAKSAYVT